MLKITAQAIISKYVKNKLTDKPSITEKELTPILREIRIAFLNSDVNLEVIKAFFSEIKKELLVDKNYSFKDKPDVVVFNTIRRKLINILGDESRDLNFINSKINKYLIVGLNGSGKTTSTAKLSLYIKNKYGVKVKNVSLDIYRPGAYEQLKQLSEPQDIPCFGTKNNNFKDFIKNQMYESEQDSTRAILFDNYGLLPDNQELLEETAQIKKLINPNEVLLVVDAMSGQEIIDVVRTFHEKLGITGIVISKTDSNAPMGAVFSIAYLLKIPVKFMGKGESIHDLTVFYPDRIANLILGEGDILSLAEKMEKVSDVDTSRKLFAKIMKGSFDLEDLIKQIKEVRKIGSLKSIFKLLPGGFNDKTQFLDGADDQLRVWEILISSMTIKERRNPKLFKKQPNRKVRVIKGSGRKPDELNKLLKKWEESKKKLDEILASFKRGKNPFSFFTKG